MSRLIVISNRVQAPTPEETGAQGGLAVALAEMAIAAGIGIDADLDGLVELRGCSGETALFGEGPGGIVLGLGPEAAEELLRGGEAAGVQAIALGTARGRRIEISAAEREVTVLTADAARAWESLATQLEPAE